MGQNSIVAPFIQVSPSVTTIYTLTGAGVNGCNSSATSAIQVDPAPSIMLSASDTLVCKNAPVWLQAAGAMNYTWLPIGVNGSSIVVNPSANTIYTCVGASAGG